MRLVTAKSPDTLLKQEKQTHTVWEIKTYLIGITVYVAAKVARNAWQLPTNLQGQQAFVDLSSLQTSLAVSTRCVSPPLITCEVDEGELSMHLPLPPKNDLENGVAARGVCVGRCLP